MTSRARRAVRKARRSTRRVLTPVAERWLGPLVKRGVYMLAFDVLVCDLSRPLPTMRPHGDVDVRRIAGEEPSWWEEHVKPARVAAIRAALADGDVGHVALVQEKIVAEVWATRLTKGDVRIRLGCDEAYSYGLTSDEAHRALGTASAVMSALLTDLQQQGTARVYGWVDRRNRPSQVLLRTRFGFRQVQRARRVRVLRRWGFVVPGSRTPAQGPLADRPGVGLGSPVQ
jgi:L-amino acid N-acyltransferase YncA